MSRLGTRTSSSASSRFKPTSKLSLSPSVANASFSSHTSPSNLAFPRPSPTATSPVDHDALSDSLHSYEGTDEGHEFDSEFETASPVEHPFAQTTNLLTVLREGDEHVDLEAERAFYDQFPGLRPDEDDHEVCALASEVYLGCRPKPRTRRHDTCAGGREIYRRA